MPNHCENDLYIRGRASDVAKVLAAIKSSESEFDFNTLLPYPARYKEMDAEYNKFSRWGGGKDLDDATRAKMEAEYKRKYGQTDYAKDGYNCGGYDWCSDNWGTKWNAYDITVKQNKNGSAKITFQTAWAPPVPVIEALAKRFSKGLTFKLNYFEMGMAYQGTREYVDGTLVHESQTKYSGNRGG